MGATELTLIAGIKPGLVAIAEPTAYSGRLRLLFDTFFELRSTIIEKVGDTSTAGPLELLRSLQRIHWSIHDTDRKLLLAVSFDGPWEPYIRNIVEKAGPLLDVIFCHCDGYEGHTCFDGYPEFAEWVREHQVRCDFFYAGSPELTVDDVRYLQQFEQAHSLGDPSHKLPSFDDQVVRMRVTDQRRVSDIPPEKIPAEKLSLAWSRYDLVLQSLMRLQKYFPDEPGKPINERELFNRALRLMTEDIRPQGQRPRDLGTKGPLGAFAKMDASLGASLDVAAPVRVEAEARETIQGNVLKGYDSMTDGRLVLVQFADRSRKSEALRKLAEEVTTEASDRSRPIKMNVALTFDGLAALGLPREVLASFPREFQEGMAARAGMLGDVITNHPDRWRLPRRNWPRAEGAVGDEIHLSIVDAVIQFQGSDPARVPKADPSASTESAELEAALDAAIRNLKDWGLDVLHVQDLRRQYNEHEQVVAHFGFVDGVSQPEARPPAPTTTPPPRDQVALGELLLGYQNERGETGPRLPPELSKNSTFLVIRKLAQDVAAFEKEFPNDQIRAKLLGREPAGKPLIATTPGPGQWNDFDYTNDKEGTQCPFFSHIRRSNPREHKDVYARKDLRAPKVRIPTPRIARRGFSYGRPYDPNGAGPDNEERGLMFMAVNASIADQFEVVQRWVNGGNSTGVLSGCPDLIAGNFPPSDGATPRRHVSYVDGGGQIKEVPLPAKPLVTLQWGVYSFVPSTTALRYLSAESEKAEKAMRPSSEKQADDSVKKLVASLKELEDQNPASAEAEWKRLLEDRDLRPTARAIWGYVRSEGGVLRTPYGVLVGSEAGVRDVLTHDDVFSVREYWKRMEEAFGGHYLGEDRNPARSNGSSYPVAKGDYDRDSAETNQILYAIPASKMFERAREIALVWFASRPAVTPGDQRMGDVSALARHVVATIATEQFGLPDGNLMDEGDEQEGSAKPSRCPFDFQRVSQYVFFPDSTTTLANVARARGTVVREQVDEFLKATKASFVTTLKGVIDRMKPRPSDVNVALRRLLIGTVNGFVVPTSGTFVSVMSQWIENRELWRWQSWWEGEGKAEIKRVLADPSEKRRYEGLTKSPIFKGVYQTAFNLSVPDLLHRTAVKAHNLGTRSLAIQAGDHVVISLSSAAAENGSWDLLFGGARDPERGPDTQKPVHACPGQPMAVGVLLGMIAGTLEQKGLRKKNKIMLTFD